jgi:protein tyrosine phosphatase (PTP) superfamily phosphohydrolase (DUF442 family)
VSLSLLAPPRRRTFRWARRLLVAFVAFLVVGNLLIFGSSLVFQLFGPDGTRPEGVVGIDHLRVVDDRVWRGGAPTPEGYQSLAAHGVTTIVDLRAGAPAEELDGLRQQGFDVVQLPVTDGQAPGADVIRQLVEVVERSPGIVFVHCQAGVGRTGSVVAGYRVWVHDTNGLRTTADNLAVGPPTLEQLYFTMRLTPGDADRPPLPVVLTSRVLDAPRQLWNHLFG